MDTKLKYQEIIKSILTGLGQKKRPKEVMM